jgi:iron complex outermembrane receptor protein
MRNPNSRREGARVAWERGRAGAILACAVALPAAASHDEPVKGLGTTTVTGARPTSLPSQIPTTIEGTTGERVEESINASDSEDAIKYLPSLLVRKRNIGDYDHAVLSSRASGTGNSARSLVYADGILLSNLLGNGASFTPRWGMVTPEEIERVDVLYGPFSAAFPGNSVGAVVDYITRMPEKLEAQVKASAFTQRFHLYNTDERYSGYQLAASIGSRAGAFSWWLAANRLDNEGQPLTFATKVIATGTPGTAGTPVTGAVFGENPRTQPQWIIGTGTQTETTQDHGKVKLAYDFTPGIRATYVLGYWANDSRRNAATYLRDPAGNPVFGGNVNIDGRSYSIAATEMSPNRSDMEHVIQGFSLKKHGRTVFDWEVSASVYDYSKDIIRSTTVALPGASSGGAGRITEQDGTGWITLAVKGTWRPQGVAGSHLVDFGVQRDHYKLRTLVSNTSNWISGSPESRFSAFQGDTYLTSLYVQDTWHLARDWRATLGLRAERWEADNGAVTAIDVTRQFATRQETEVSPKAALAWQFAPEWVGKWSLGRAVRNPTVAELYQGSLTAGQIVNNDPNLEAEKSWTSELTAERDLGNGVARATLFYERTKDALYSQTNVTVVPNVTNIQNVDEIETEGVEISYQQADVGWKGLEIQASVTYAHSIIERNDRNPASVGKWQPRVPQWRASALATYRPSEDWSFSLGARYGGTQYSQLDNSDTNGFAYTGVSRFLVVDARARWRFAPGWSASLGVDNLTDEIYWNFHPYPRRTWIGELRYAY